MQASFDVLYVARVCVIVEEFHGVMVRLLVPLTVESESVTTANLG